MKGTLKRIRVSPGLSSFVAELRTKYEQLYRANHKGREKYSHFLVDWHRLLVKYAVSSSSPEESTWLGLVNYSESPELCSIIDARDRSAFVTAIANAVYELLGENGGEYTQALSSSPSMLVSHPQAKAQVADDDASIVRVSGFALHSAIRFRKRALRKPTRHSQSVQESYVKELRLLERMCAHDRSFLPSVVKFQHRGKITIMHSAMFEFGCILFSTVRESLNYTAYMQKGANLFTHIHHSTMHNAELQHVFKSSILSLPCANNEEPLELDESVVSKVYNTIVEKMMHTMNNDFLISLR